MSLYCIPFSIYKHLFAKNLRRHVALTTPIWGTFGHVKVRTTLVVLYFLQCFNFFVYILRTCVHCAFYIHIMYYCTVHLLGTAVSASICFVVLSHYSWEIVLFYCFMANYRVGQKMTQLWLVILLQPFKIK